MANPTPTLPRPDEDQDEKLNPGGAGRDLYREESAPQLTPGELAAQDQLDAAERDASLGGIGPLGGGFYSASPGGKKASFSFQGLRRKGPIAGILALITGVGIGGTVLFSGAGIFGQLSQVFNVFDRSAPVLGIRTNAALQKKIDGIRNGFDQSSPGRCDVKCRLGSISSSMKDFLDNPNTPFTATFSDRKFGGRYVLTSLTFPDGTVVTSRSEFDAAMTDPTRLKDFRLTFNNRIKYFLNSSRFVTKLNMFGLNRLAKISGTSADAIAESIRAATGAPPADSPDEIDNRKVSKFNTKINAKVAERGGKAADVIGTACLAYDVAKIAQSATKLEKIAAYGGFAIAFLSVSEQVMAGDAPDPAVLSALGSQLTRNGSATDSQIYRQAAYGDRGVSNSIFTMAPAGGMVASLTTLTGFLEGTGDSRPAISGTCRTGQNPVVSTAITAAICAAGGTAATLIGSVIAASVCTGLNFVGGALLGEVVALFIPTLIEQIVKDGLNIPDETTSGVDAGQVIGLGSQQLFNSKSQSYGMSPATSVDEVVAFNQAVSGEREIDRMIAREEAKDDPFNIDNPNSFLGTFAASINSAGFYAAGWPQKFGSVLGILPRSLSTLANSASAYTNKVGYDESAVYSGNDCPELAAIGVVGDTNCVETYVMSEDELRLDSFVVADALIASNNINADTGAAIPGSDYDKFETYCGVGRVDPMGESSFGIASEDFEWQFGSKCAEKSSAMSNYRVWHMEMGIQDMIDQEPPVSIDDSAVLPVDPDYQISSDFGPREAPCSTCSSNHAGIDFSNFPGGTSGRPVYAAMAGEVVGINDDVDNTVSIKQANGSVAQYLHMFDEDINVKLGDSVTKGQQIGKIGDAGNSTGPHLDFRVYIDGVDLSQNAELKKIVEDSSNVIKNGSRTYVNPRLYLGLFGVKI
jgi:murein DD-endopeptidase MepM/ murein hydrolase activator NlpD